jgi:hypothetical protein
LIGSRPVNLDEEIRSDEDSSPFLKEEQTMLSQTGGYF